MRRILTLTLAVHWMCVFAMLAIVCTVEPHDGFAAPLRLLGLETGDLAVDGGSEAAAFFAVAFLLVAVLFFVAASDFLVDGRGRRHPSFAAAFGTAALSLTLLLVAGALEPVPHLFIAVESVLAAVLVSYLAIRVEPIPRRADEEAGDIASVARLMALGAAHSSLLDRHSRRPAGDASPRNV